LERYRKEGIVHYAIDKRGINPFGALSLSKRLLQSKRIFIRAANHGLWLFFLLGCFTMLPMVLAQSNPSNQTTAYSQEGHQLKKSGSLIGSIRDPHNAAVVGAKVRMTDLATNQSFTAATNEQGDYQFSLLPSADYNLEISTKGLKTARILNVRVTAYNTVTQDVVLSIGETSQVVQVTAENDNEPLTRRKSSIFLNAN
jgi:hypothetical protein